ncbi:MarR family transcriptional regulator [Actinomycetospora endophytica]|uniref:MarR family transcriptional regulator n=1 Tax=Actinomycetospora endophytica TaxID=2291215 RepID=A0ABS8PF99_9PSEU|nr:MarR family transcriptional regulator [Actinomycetospora endophytica]MCD2195684.1 MarR family transcriptional regulator [Actinomycetospora endophytica]
MSGAELAFRLFGAFRSLVDDLHDELARRGHPAVRPAHGFALQAIGARGATATELGVRLGVSKQAAGKTVDGLAALGYVERTADPTDARRKIVVVTPAGREVLRLSVEIFERLRAERERDVGVTRMREMEAALRGLDSAGAPRVDASAWLSS